MAREKEKSLIVNIIYIIGLTAVPNPCLGRILCKALDDFSHQWPNLRRIASMLAGARVTLTNIIAMNGKFSLHIVPYKISELHRFMLALIAYLHGHIGF